MFDNPDAKPHKQSEKAILRAAADEESSYGDQLPELVTDEIPMAEHPAGNKDLECSSIAAESRLKAKLSDAELISLAKHPNTAESDWLRACTELNQRQAMQASIPAGLNKKMLSAIAVMTLVILTAISIWQFAPASKALLDLNSAKASIPYLLSSSQKRSDELTERAVIRLAQAIVERGWSESIAASYLAVNQSDIARLIRDPKTSFSMTELNTMLFALGQSTQFPETPTAKELQQTVAYFTRLIDTSPTNGAALRKRAGAYESLHQYDLAIADLARCIAIEPNIPGPRNNLALIYYEAGRHHEALQQFNDLHVLFPTYNIFQNRALVYSALEQYDKAIDDSTMAIRLMQSQRPGPYWNRAMDSEKLHKFADAIADYKKVLEIDPTYQSASERITYLKTKVWN